MLERHQVDLRPLYILSQDRERFDSISDDLRRVIAHGDAAMASLEPLGFGRAVTRIGELARIGQGREDRTARQERIGEIRVQLLELQEATEAFAIAPERLAQIFEENIMPSYMLLSQSYQLLRGIPFRDGLVNFADREGYTFKRLQKTALPTMMQEYLNTPQTYEELQAKIARLDELEGHGIPPLAEIIGNLREIRGEDFIARQGDIRRLLFTEYLMETPHAAMSVVHASSQLKRLGSSILLDLHSLPDVPPLDGREQIERDALPRVQDISAQVGAFRGRIMGSLHRLQRNLRVPLSPRDVDIDEALTELDGILRDRHPDGIPRQFSGMMTSMRADLAQLDVTSLYGRILTLEKLDSYHVAHEQLRATDILMEQISKLESIQAQGYDAKNAVFAISQLYDWYHESISNEFRAYIEANIDGAGEYFNNLRRIRNGIIHSVDDPDRKLRVEQALEEIGTLESLQGIAEASIGALRAFQDRVADLGEVDFTVERLDGEPTIFEDAGLGELAQRINPIELDGRVEPEAEPVKRIYQQLKIASALMEEFAELGKDAPEIAQVRIVSLLGQAFKPVVDILEANPDVQIESTLNAGSINDLIIYARDAMLFRDSIVHSGYIDREKFRDIREGLEESGETLMTLEQDIARQQILESLQEQGVRADVAERMSDLIHRYSRIREEQERVGDDMRVAIRDNILDGIVVLGRIDGAQTALADTLQDFTPIVFEDLSEAAQARGIQAEVALRPQRDAGFGV